MSNNDQTSDNDYRWSDVGKKPQNVQTKTQTSQNLDTREQSPSDQNTNNRTDNSGQNVGNYINGNMRKIEKSETSGKLGKSDDQNIGNYINGNMRKLEKSETSGKLEKSETSETSGKLEKSETSETSGKLEKSETSETSGKLETSETSGKLEKPKKSEQAITKSDIKSVIKLLQQIASGVVELQGIMPYLHNEKGRDATRKGTANIYKFGNYYDVKRTIKKAGPTDPQDFDSPVYNIERIYEDLERYSDIINVANDGTEPLFIVISHQGRTTFSQESVILPGEVKQLYNIYEIRLRSPQIGLPYRVTEYLLMSVSQTAMTPSELANIHDEHLPEKDTDWLPEDIVPLISTTTFRIQVAVSIEGIFSAAITNDGNTQIVDFNATSGPELLENSIYVFELLVHRGDSINFRYSETGGTIKILRCQEIDAATT